MPTTHAVHICPQCWHRGAREGRSRVEGDREPGAPCSICQAMTLCRAVDSSVGGDGSLEDLIDRYAVPRALLGLD